MNRLPVAQHCAYPSDEAIARRVVIGCRFVRREPPTDADMVTLQNALLRHEARRASRARWAYKFGEHYDTGSAR